MFCTLRINDNFKGHLQVLGLIPAQIVQVERVDTHRPSTHVSDAATPSRINGQQATVVLL